MNQKQKQYYDDKLNQYEFIENFFHVLHIFNYHLCLNKNLFLAGLFFISKKKMSFFRNVTVLVEKTFSLTSHESKFVFRVQKTISNSFLFEFVKTFCKDRRDL